MSEELEEIHNEQAKQIPRSTPNGNKIEKRNSFYLLLFSQLSLILLSTFFNNTRLFIALEQQFPRANTKFERYCSITQRCRIDYYHLPGYKKEDINEYEAWKTSFSQESTMVTCFFYSGLAIYPLFAILTSLFRNTKIIKKTQKWAHILSYPMISLLVQAISALLRNANFQTLLTQMQGHVGLLAAAALFLHLNQLYFKFNLKTQQTLQKLINGYFLILVEIGFIDAITLSSSNWIIPILIQFYGQTYLLHIYNNLFKNNTKYAAHNESLLKVLIKKFKSFFEVEDIYKDVGKNHFVLKKRQAYIGGLGIILSIAFREYMFSLPTLIVSSLAVLILSWDTSLVSFSSKLALDDQYLAMNMIFLDLLMPIRNVIAELVV